MRKLKSYTIIGILFVIITGSISHSIYKWSGDNFILGCFFPINESTWEHMKLLFLPMLLYSFYMNQKLKKDYPGITSALSFGILFGTLLIPVLFYTYSGILGTNCFPLDIATFAVSVLLAFAAGYKLTLSCKVSAYESLLKVLLLLLAVSFLTFTYYPPALGIFSIPKHS